MPELCRFYGIVVKMFHDDHNPPHFHAEYAVRGYVAALVALAKPVPNPRAGREKM